MVCGRSALSRQRLHACCESFRRKVFALGTQEKSGLHRCSTIHRKKLGGALAPPLDGLEIQSAMNQRIDEARLSTVKLKQIIRFAPTIWNTIAGVMVVALAHPILRLTHAESIALLQAVVPIGCFGLVYVLVVREKKCKQLEEFFGDYYAGCARPEQYAESFRLLVNMPLSEVMNAQIFWVTGPFIGVAAMYFSSDTFTLAKIVIVLMSAIAAGTYSQLFAFVHTKKLLEPYRRVAATGVPEPTLRDQLTRTVNTRIKLNIVVVSLVITSTFFCVTLTQARILQKVDAFVLADQTASLDRVRQTAETALTVGEATLPTEQAYAALGTTQYLVVEHATGKVIVGPSDVLKPGEIQAVLDTQRSEGDSSSFSTENRFRWTTLSDGNHLLIAALQGDAMNMGISHEMLFMASVIFAFVVAALLGAHVLASDVVHSIANLRSHVEKVSAQDLTRGEIFESEDDFGKLARNLDAMSLALRSTLMSVTSSADRVEEATTKIENATADVSHSSVEQRQSIREVDTSIAHISNHLTQIRESAGSLDAAVDDSSTTILDLSSSGVNLEESSALLTEKVEQVLQSFQKIFSSIGMVVDNTTVLAQIADGTTGGVEEMAAALRQVDENAIETSRLSSTVVESAKVGQDKVRAMIRGITSIQDNTQVVAGIIRELRVSTGEIGSIVNVIDSVADETNLLALNAAIIAAQAGEQGRAFSVVADEIKSLADRVIANTKEITQVIGSVQNDAQKAVAAIEKGSASVEEGMRLSQEAGTALDAINVAAHESGNRMHEVVRAVQEQSQAAQHMTRLMSEMSSAVEKIHFASREQEGSTSEALHSNQAMSEAVQQVTLSTREQALSFEKIAKAVQSVEGVANGIARSLQEQAHAIAQVSALMKRVNERTQTNDSSTQRMGESVKTLMEEAANLYRNVQRFKL